MALKGAERCRPCFPPVCNRSRTTSDFDIFRFRDSASMSAANGSGRRTVRVFMRAVYYTHVSRAMHGRDYRLMRTDCESKCHSVKDTAAVPTPAHDANAAFAASSTTAIP